jgi:hypothetical protein
MCISDIILSQGASDAPSGVECPPHKRGAWVLSGVSFPRQIEESSKSSPSIGFPREGPKEKSDHSVVNHSSCFSFGTCGRRRLVAARSDVEGAKADIHVVQAELANALAVAGYSKIVSPWHGIVTKRGYRVGDRDLERLAGGYARTGQGHVSDSLKATYYRLEADQLLAEAGGQDASQVQLPDLPKGVHAAQPQSPPPTTPR